MMRLEYGKTVVTGEEDFIGKVVKSAHTVERVASPGAYLVDTFPSLMKLPDFLAPFKREGKRLYRDKMNLFKELQDDVRQQIQSGTGDGSENFTSIFLKSKEKWELSDDEGAFVMGTLFEAGTGTTSAAMMSFIFAMTMHPLSLAKLQKEIDEAVGDRIPSEDDVSNLPSVRAVVKETLRWRPVTAGGIPHLLVKDDIYEMGGKKYFLPAGSNVHANQWAIHRDPNLYPEPEKFIPERWLEKKYPTFREPLSSYPNIKNFTCFGHGRRICGGQKIAETSLNIQVARIAWGCDIQKVQGWTPKEYDYTKGFNAQPERFPFILSPRKGRERIVEEKYESVWRQILDRSGERKSL